MERCASHSKVTGEGNAPWVRHGEAGCPVETTLRLIGGKWKARIAFHLYDGPLRYTELRRALPGISAQVLTGGLREMERDGLVSREVFAEVPPRTEYRLTPVGESLAPVVEAMSAWGQSYREAQNAGGRAA